MFRVWARRVVNNGLFDECIFWSYYYHYLIIMIIIIIMFSLVPYYLRHLRCTVRNESPTVFYEEVLFLLISTGTFRTVRNTYCVVSREYLLRFRFEMRALKVDGTSVSPLCCHMAVFRIWIRAEPRTHRTQCRPGNSAELRALRRGTDAGTLCHCLGSTLRLCRGSRPQWQF